MRTATVTITGVSPYSQGAPMKTPKTREETHADYDEKYWRERCHVNSDGFVFIPPMAFKNCLAEAAKYNSIQIPGKGKSTYTKHFEAGTMCVEQLVLPVKIEDVEQEYLFVPADGQRNGKKRVWKHFPIFREWGGVVTFLILDEIVDEEVFEQHLIDAGRFIGIGRFRPRNNGYYGRFEVDKIEWS